VVNCVHVTSAGFSAGQASLPWYYFYQQLNRHHCPGTIFTNSWTGIIALALFLPTAGQASLPWYYFYQQLDRHHCPGTIFTNSWTGIIALVLFLPNRHQLFGTVAISLHTRLYI
jgi:hypothetical protein